MITRFPNNPIITQNLSPEIGNNINGASVIRVPNWVERPLGKYYMYFAHHQGKFIRLAYADSLEGPWHYHAGGVLPIDETSGANHVASPDVHIDDQLQTIVMYFHTYSTEKTGGQGQVTLRATSHDGLNFTSDVTTIGPFYFRVFHYNGAVYTFTRSNTDFEGGMIMRSPDGIAPFVDGPCMLENLRHAAARVIDDTAYIVFSRRGDTPERLFLSTIDLSPNWKDWIATDPVEILRPETPEEGSLLPVTTSKNGCIMQPIHELRDPDLFFDNGNTYLFYCGAGETNICGAHWINFPEI